MTAVKRLSRELKNLTENPIPSVEFDVDDILHWKIKIDGPCETPYHKGTFTAVLSFPSNYPFVAPKLTFQTRIFHPNINPKGDICIGLLGDGWTIRNTVRDIINSILSVLVSPLTDNPLVPEISTLYKNNPEKFAETAKAWTLTYAA